MSVKENRTEGIWITLSGGACWGLSGCFGQYLFQEKGITAEWLVTMRLFFAGLLLIALGLVLVKKKMGDVWKHPTDKKRLLIFSIGGMLTCQYTYFAAIQYSNAGTATVLQSLNPLIILAIVCMKQKRLPKKFEAVAIF
ncbi:MAG: DMT family transporter, partial [Anaerotignum sp.]|nr:DMT family transporter [Anaerotignum sp.]